MSKLHVKKGDNVIVIAGNDKSNKPRRVLAVYPDKQRVLVEEVNMVSKATKPNAQNPQGGVVKKEAPIHISNVMLIDPKDGKRTRIQRIKNEEGKLVRVAVRSKEVIK
ncbi:50S ribosomal protein L24 [Porphyromonadaceae bacterium COT-184 OH4590]|nr:50S ribosomal protein L24 [Porphyromonadaceae bacterium COT-184 OH4590]